MSEEKEYEEIIVETEDSTITAYVPVDPPFTTVIQAKVKSKHNKEPSIHWVPLSTDIIQSMTIFNGLRQKDPKVVKAFNWVIEQNTIFNASAIHCLCYDFNDRCPYVEITRKEWLTGYDKEKENSTNS